jgi:hypothetical protein
MTVHRTATRSTPSHPATDGASRRRPAARLVLCLVAESAALLLLVHADPAADAPPIGRDIGRWWAGHDPLDAAASASRALAVAVTTYLVAVTALHLLAVVSRRRRLGRVATRLGPRFLVRLAATATIGTSAIALTSGPAAFAAESPAPVGAGATMEVVDAVPAVPHTSLPWADAAPTTTTPAPTTPTPDPTVGAGGVGPATTAEQPAPPPPGPTTATTEAIVHEGDSMWTLARDELAARLGRRPTDAEIDPYWRSLIAANRDRLVDHDDPSLIYPGQSFVLPA